MRNLKELLTELDTPDLRVRDLFNIRNRITGLAEEMIDRAERESRGLSAREKLEYEGILAGLKKVNREIEKRNGHQTLSGPPLKPIPYGDWEPGDELLPGQVRAIAPEQRFTDAVTYSMPDGIRPEELSTGRMLRGLLTGRWEGAEAEQRAFRALGGSDDVLGGYLLPTPLSARVIDLARARAALLAAGALTVPMESAELSLARLESDPNTFWKLEGNEGTEDTAMNFGRIHLRAKLLMGLVRVSLELLEDAPNSGDVIENALAEALGLELDRAGMFGEGAAAEPVGLFNDDQVTVQLMGANGAPLDGYDDFSVAVQAVAQLNGTARAAILSPRDAGALDRKKDGQGQPLQAPESWKGLKKVVSNQIPVDLVQGAASNTSAAFVGDFNQVLIGMRKEIVIEASREASDVFEKHQVLIRGVLRADLVIQRPGHIVRIVGILPDA